MLKFENSIIHECLSFYFKMSSLQIKYASRFFSNNIWLLNLFRNKQITTWILELLLHHYCNAVNTLVKADSTHDYHTRSQGLPLSHPIDKGEVLGKLGCQVVAKI